MTEGWNIIPWKRGMVLIHAKKWQTLKTLHKEVWHKKCELATKDYKVPKAVGRGPVGNREWLLMGQSFFGEW